VLLIALPAAVGIAALAAPLLISLFQYGAFSMHDVLMARQSLWAYCIGIPAFMLIKVLASAFYAQQNIRTPVKVAVVAVLLNIALNALLIGPLLHAGLALATTLSAWCNVLGLLYMAHRYDIYAVTCSWWLYLTQCVLALIAMGMVLKYTVPKMQAWQLWDAPHRAGVLLALIALGAVVYCLVLWCSGTRWQQWRQKSE
jgi:putative peptidoglycan lipid II flippase